MVVPGLDKAIASLTESLVAREPITEILVCYPVGRYIIGYRISNLSGRHIPNTTVRRVLLFDELK
jgi:hypothetical protein